jgi:hypothetical protein
MGLCLDPGFLRITESPLWSVFLCQTDFLEVSYVVKREQNSKRTNTRSGIVS